MGANECPGTSTTFTLRHYAQTLCTKTDNWPREKKTKQQSGQPAASLNCQLPTWLPAGARASGAPAASAGGFWEHVMEKGGPTGRTLTDSFIFLKICFLTTTIFPCSHQLTGTSSRHWSEKHAPLRFQGHLPHLCHWLCSCKRLFSSSGFCFNFWCMKCLCSTTLQYHVSLDCDCLTVYTSLELWEFIFTLQLFYAGVPLELSAFPGVFPFLCCYHVGYCDPFSLFPLDWFLSRWMPSDFLCCFSVTPSSKMVQKPSVSSLSWLFHSAWRNNGFDITGKKNIFPDRRLSHKERISMAKEWEAEPVKVTYKHGSISAPEQLLRDATSLQSDTTWHLSCLSASHYEPRGQHQHVCMYHLCKYLKDHITSSWLMFSRAPAVTQAQEQLWTVWEGLIGP